MGGVDRADKLDQFVPSMDYTKKLYFPLISRMLGDYIDVMEENWIICIFGGQLVLF